MTRMESADAAVRQGAATTLQSVRRAAKLLVAAAESDGLSAREAAERFSLSLPTAYHLLNSLASEGLLAKESRGYVLGPLASVIADGVGRDRQLPARLTTALRGLVDQVGETAYLSAWSRGEVRLLAVIEGSHVVRVNGLAVDYNKNLHARTSARVLLAYAEPHFAEQCIAGFTLRKLTPGTITSRDRLRQDLARIRTAGLAIGRDEYAPGLTCASVPVTDHGAVVAALTVAAPSERFRATERELLAALSAAGQAASIGPAR